MGHQSEAEIAMLCSEVGAVLIITMGPHSNNDNK